MIALLVVLLFLLGLATWAFGIAAVVSFWVGIVLLILNLAGLGSVDADLVWTVWKYWGGFAAAAVGCGLSVLIVGAFRG